VFQDGGYTKARALVQGNTQITVADLERLLGYLEGESVAILPEPQVLLTPTPKLPGLDGRKMSKSYGNTIGLREEPESVARKLRTMQTDPARARRSDPGTPEKCPVWSLHQLYSADEQLHWVIEGCRSASIGCLDCKSALCSSLQGELAPLQQRAIDYEDSPDLVRSILAEGAERARDEARETLAEVRMAMGLNYR
jgi:tryptophanyl-tRNA synthetase